MLLSKTIRRQVMKGNSDEIRKLLLTDSQVKVIEWLGTVGETTSAQASQALGTSMPQASTQLARLHHKGYLDRSYGSAGTGGVEFIYSVAKGGLF